MSETDTFVIIGAGLGGVCAASALRQAGYAGRIILLNKENQLPYDRPPLSKGILQGTEGIADICLKPDSWYVQNAIDLRTDVMADRIDPDAREVQLDDGSIVKYTKLLIATGAEARRIPPLEQELLPYFYLRSYYDAVGLQEYLKPGKRLVLIGAGVIGLEVAASAIKCGCKVTVVEIADRVMARSVPPTISAWLRRQHESHGVTFHFEDSVAGFSGDANNPGLLLTGGTRLPADAMLICAGVVPDDQLAQQCGLECNNGIVVDQFCQTSHDDIYAVGDVAAYPDAWLGRTVRSENWMHAQRHAECAAANMIGAAEPYAEIQSVWTDQYDFKLQVAGVLEGDQEVTRGDMGSGNFMSFYLREGSVVGVLGVNQAKFMRVGHNFIKSGARVDTAVLADPESNLKKAG
jgi:NADPH-dependent 2,4-dienoyl-CoA reductase/sulfur reductase-like enzyme